LWRNAALGAKVATAAEAARCVGVKGQQAQCQGRAQHHQEFIHQFSKPD
jgi:hypothetical protein